MTDFKLIPEGPDFRLKYRPGTVVEYRDQNNQKQTGLIHEVQVTFAINQPDQEVTYIVEHPKYQDGLISCPAHMVIGIPRPKLTNAQAEILICADRWLDGAHYISSINDDHWDDCQALCKMGYLKQGHPTDKSNLRFYFFITAEGVDAILAWRKE